MYVVDGLDLPAAFASGTEKLACRHLPDDCLFDFTRADRRRSHAADGHRGAGELAGRVSLDQDGGRRDGEITVPARELNKGITVI